MQKKKPLNIVVFSPHPDDDLIGCGGSIIKHLQAGNNVAIVYVTSGDAGSLTYTKRELGVLREQEAKAAADFLGITDLTFMRYLDGYLTYNQETLVAMISLIRKKRPDVVYTPHGLDGHKDHSTTFDIVKEAVIRASGPWFQECAGAPHKVGMFLCYEVWTPLQEVSYTEDISDVVEKKIQALCLHVSQIKDIQYDEAIKGLNRYRGAMTGVGKYAECFKIISGSNF